MPVPPEEFLAFIEQIIPFNRFLGIRLDASGDGFVRLRLPFRPELIGDPVRPALHGGVISTLVDAAGGLAVWTRIQFDDRVSTIDLRVDYLAPGAPDELLAEATVVRLGNRVAVVDVRCTQPSSPERVVATGKGVYNIKRRDDT
jgi:uncharacterized protein (TIGR00369 family)